MIPQQFLDVFKSGSQATWWPLLSLARMVAGFTFGALISWLLTILALFASNPGANHSGSIALVLTTLAVAMLGGVLLGNLPIQDWLWAQKGRLCSRFEQPGPQQSICTRRHAILFLRMLGGAIVGFGLAAVVGLSLLSLHLLWRVLASENIDLQSTASLPGHSAVWLLVAFSALVLGNLPVQDWLWMKMRPPKRKAAL